MSSLLRSEKKKKKERRKKGTGHILLQGRVFGRPHFKYFITIYLVQLLIFEIFKNVRKTRKFSFRSKHILYPAFGFIEGIEWIQVRNFPKCPIKGAPIFLFKGGGAKI